MLHDYLRFAPFFVLAGAIAMHSGCSEDSNTSSSNDDDGSGASDGGSTDGGNSQGGNPQGGNPQGGNPQGGNGGNAGGDGGDGGMATTCGDSVIDSGETCDDGDMDDGDGCDSDCQEESGWDCDGMDPTVCTPICGDGILVTGEECDDNNLLAYDGCSPTCIEDMFWDCTELAGGSACAPICGDGHRIDAGTLCGTCGAAECTAEATACGADATCAKSVACAVGCADGACIDACAASFPSAATTTLQTCLATNCSQACAPAAALESCDDMGTALNDGCDDTCRVELYSRCTGEGAGSCHTINILYAPSDDDAPVLRAAVATITGGTMDYFDPRSVVPTANDFVGYDCIHSWANNAYADAIATGDAFAAYVDQGNAVALGVFATYTNGFFLDGFIMDSGYSPVNAPTGDNHYTTSTYNNDGTTVIHTAVTTYECQYRDILALQGPGLQDGTYQDAEVATAYRPDYGVTYINGSGADNLACTGDWALLTANACAAHFAR